MFNSILEAVLHFAEANPNKLAVADDNKELTYSEYSHLIKLYASVLKKLGVSKGDKVVLEAEQSVDYLGLQMALWTLGAIFVPLEHNCSSAKIKDILGVAEAKFAITDKTEDLEDTQVFSYNYFKEAAETVSSLDNISLPYSDDISEILFSTGTTGKEKGIVLTHKNNIALAHNVIYGVEMLDDNVELIPSPMNHSHGLRRYYANMYKGATVIILGSVMNVRKMFECFDKYGVTAMDLVPAALSVVLKLTKDKLSEYKEQLRYIQYGAAPLAEDDKLKVCSLLPKTRMYNFYGSTESGCTFIYNFNVANPKKNCIGKPTYSVTAILADDDHKEVSQKDGNNGLLATKGNMNMSGYWKDEEETRKALIDGVVYSNDIAFFDQDGEVILLGRKGDVINVGGNKVSPDEIENIAKKMDIIVDCGCIPVEDKSKGSVPKLFVQLKHGAEFDSVEIRRFLSGYLEPYKVPVYIEQINKIPRSFNGKLLRKELK